MPEAKTINTQPTEAPMVPTNETISPTPTPIEAVPIPVEIDSPESIVWALSRFGRNLLEIRGDGQIILRGKTIGFDKDVAGTFLTNIELERTRRVQQRQMGIPDSEEKSVKKFIPLEPVVGSPVDPNIDPSTGLPFKTAESAVNENASTMEPADEINPPEEEKIAI